MKGIFDKPPSRVLLLDLEVSPNFGAFYDRYETTPISVDRYQWIMCAAWKWLGQDKIYCYAQPDFPLWKKDKFDDSEVVRKLWEAMNKAEIIVAHNAKKFDIKKANTRFLVNDLGPPRPFKVVDTLTSARKHFGFVGNSLNDLCKQLKIGQKKEKTHSDLWQDCINGKKEAWNHMKEYNKHDVFLLERIYRKLAPFVEPFPIVHVDNGKCRKCGSGNRYKRGLYFTRKGKYPKLQCTNCGSWEKGDLIKEE